MQRSSALCGQGISLRDKDSTKSWSVLKVRPVLQGTVQTSHAVRRPGTDRGSKTGTRKACKGWTINRDILKRVLNFDAVNLERQKGYKKEHQKGLRTGPGDKREPKRAPARRESRTSVTPHPT